MTDEEKNRQKILLPENHFYVFSNIKTVIHKPIFHFHLY